MRMSDGSSDVCSSDLRLAEFGEQRDEEPGRPEFLDHRDLVGVARAEVGDRGEQRGRRAAVVIRTLVRFEMPAGPRLPPGVGQPGNVSNDRAPRKKNGDQSGKTSVAPRTRQRKT